MASNGNTFETPTLGPRVGLLLVYTSMGHRAQPAAGTGREGMLLSGAGAVALRARGNGSGSPMGRMAMMV